MPLLSDREVTRSTKDFISINALSGNLVLIVRSNRKRGTITRNVVPIIHRYAINGEGNNSAENAFGSATCNAISIQLSTSWNFTPLSESYLSDNQENSVVTFYLREINNGLKLDVTLLLFTFIYKSLLLNDNFELQKNSYNLR